MESCDPQSEDENPGWIEDDEYGEERFRKLVQEAYRNISEKLSEKKEWSEFFKKRDYQSDPESRLQEVFGLVKKKDWMVSLGTLDVFFDSPIGNNIKIEFWRENGYPKPILICLMRDIVNLVGDFDSCGITNRELRPCCVDITRGDDPLDPEKESGLYAVLSEECFKKGHESLDSPPPDVVVALGQLLLFCMTGGGMTDSRATKCLKTSSDEQATKSYLDFTALENIPEAMDLIPALLNARPDKRYLLGEFKRLKDIKHHPLFWDDHTKFQFMLEASAVVRRQGCQSLVRMSSSIDTSSQDNEKKAVKILNRLEEEACICARKKFVGALDYKEEARKRYMSRYPQLFIELYKATRECDPIFILCFCHELGRGKRFL